MEHQMSASGNDTTGYQTGGARGSDLSGTSRRFARLAAIEDHWHAAKPLRDLPLKRDVGVEYMGAARDYVFLASLIAPGMVKLRAAGAQVEAAMGMDPRGMPLSALFDAESRTRLFDAIDRMARTPAICDLPIQADRGFLRRPVAGRLVLLPMRDDDGAITRVLGGLAFDTPVLGRAGSQLRIPAQETFRLEEIRVQRDAPRPAHRRPAPVAKAQPAIRLVVNNA